MSYDQIYAAHGTAHIPWNKARLIGPKPPFKLREIWAIRIRLQLTQRIRELALFNLAIDARPTIACSNALSREGARSSSAATAAIFFRSSVTITSKF